MFRPILLLGTALALPLAARAGEAPDVRIEMQRVLARLERVEAENRTLKARIEKLEVVPPASPVDELKAAAPPAKSAYDLHLDREGRRAAPAPAAARVFGHAAVNTWAGGENVHVRAGKFGTSNVWDSALGVAARLGDDTALRMRAFTVLPSIGGEGDGFGNNRDYAYMRDVYLVAGRLFGTDAVNLRLGRVPYAFGEENLQLDAPANPLVSHSAAFMWGYDEGAQVFGRAGEVSYTLNLNLDGEIGNGSDNFSSKARGVRVAGDHGEHWHWSASYFDAGRASASEFWIGALPIVPVGAFTGTGAPGGASPSGSVRSRFAEGALRYAWAHGYLAIAAGRGEVDDVSPVHDRELDWFRVEPVWRFRRRWYAAGRYSELRVDGRQLGYNLRTFENDGADLGADVHALQRLSLGLGYRASERLTYKLERTMDDVDLIPTPLARAAGPGDRNYTVLQAAAEF